MKKRKIAHTDIEVAPLNFGGNVFGWTLDKQASFSILDGFVDGGFNFIDTADTYPWWVNGSGGISEEIIGEWMKQRGNRDRMVIATKVGSHNKFHDYDISKAHIIRSAEESLTRLKTDVIDIYYTHFDDNETPVEETLEAYDELVSSGKVRYIAASNLSPERLKASFEASEKYGLPRYIALQPHYNLIERNYEMLYAPLVEQYELSVFPYWSLAAGFLTGKYRTEADLSSSARGGGVKKYLNDKGFRVLSALDEVAVRHGCSQATVALAWLLAQPAIIAPIVSATKVSHLEAMFAAVDLRLDAEDIALLNAAGQ